jgi:hypothetical protein
LKQISLPPVTGKPLPKCKTGSSEYSSYEDEYGLPYLKQLVLYQKVLDYITENAVLT